jgi:hypothetical protein
MVGDFVNTFQLAKELDKFMEKGLGPPDNVAFSRAQVNAKFTQWKESFREPGERRLIEEGNVESIENIRKISCYTHKMLYGGMRIRRKCPHSFLPTRLDSLVVVEP